MQQPDESNPYEEVYKDSSTFLKVGKVFILFFLLLSCLLCSVYSPENNPSEVLEIHIFNVVPLTFCTSCQNVRFIMFYLLRTFGYFVSHLNTSVDYA